MMIKFIKRHLDHDLIKLALIHALMFCLLFNSAVFLYKFGFYKVNIMTAILEIVKDFIYNLIILFVCFFGLGISRWPMIIGSYLLYITGACASYYLFFFKISPSYTVIQSVFDTHATEVFELFSVRLIVWIIFSLSICTYVFKHFKFQATKLFFTKILCAICLLLLTMNVIHPTYSMLKTYFPIQYLHNTYLYLFGKNSTHARVSILDKFEFSNSSDEEVTAVLVIGESARYDHFGINGYEKDTTPELEKVENLVTLKARSCAGSTLEAVPCMLSRYGEADLDKVYNETSVVSAIKDQGFSTMLVATQSISKRYRSRKGGVFYDDIDFNLVPGGAIAMQPNSLDEKLLPYLDQKLSKPSDKKNFLILHTTGSHWNYKNRYPQEFAKFKPDINFTSKGDPTSPSKEELVNSYDNSVLYTDFFLSEVISRLKDKNAFMIYVSDHGESLGEEGYYMHNSDNDRKEQKEVPFIVWFSDSYIKNHPDQWKNINLNKDKYISHDYLFHTLLDCLQISSDAIDQNMSLCK